jgi:uncharacterized protein (TIGR02246 family)
MLRVLRGRSLVVFAGSFFCIAACLFARAQQADEELSQDEQLIRKSVVGFVEQYNAHQPAEIAALFATDARMVFAEGDEVNCRDEIRQAFEEEFEARPKAAISVVVDSIRLLTPDVAVEEGTTNLFPDGETLASKSRYTVLHLKRDGEWRMQSVRVVREEAVSAYAQLQSLEWLVGDWVDEGRDEDIESTFRWDENKSFLLEEFRVVSEGQVVLKGTQRFGWDPQAKTIRSWIFDSAGGFGETTWSRIGDTWVGKAKGVSADGMSASATRTLTKESTDRVRVSAADRIAGDEVLPDYETVMVRRPPQADLTALQEDSKSQ